MHAAERTMGGHAKGHNGEIAVASTVIVEAISTTVVRAVKLALGPAIARHHHHQGDP